VSGFEISGKVGIVTGGVQGIGRAIVETLASEGASVVVFDLNVEDAPACAALALSVDVSDEAAVSAVFEQVDAKFPRLDFLVNNACIDIETEPSEEWLAAPPRSDHRRGPERCIPLHAASHPANATAGLRLGRQHRVGRSVGGRRDTPGLRGE
jgi:NAD(P)-dependent dehydrogenase (short-subunit alcohol dehydrogenase family)